MVLKNPKQVNLSANVPYGFTVEVSGRSFFFNGVDYIGEDNKPYAVDEIIHSQLYNTVPKPMTEQSLVMRTEEKANQVLSKALQITEMLNQMMNTESDASGPVDEQMAAFENFQK